jgi:deoxycytidylate deaminase
MDQASADQTELFIALVAAVGTDVGMIADQVAIQLDEYRYSAQILRLSDYLAEQAANDFRKRRFDEQLWDAMTAGDELRREWKRDDALALHAVSDIVATRKTSANPDASSSSEGLPPNLARHAFIIRSLKTPGELEALRSIYGWRLIVVGAYSPKEMRLEHLAHLIEDARKTADRNRWFHLPEELIERDEKEEAFGGQDVSGTFHRADFFIRGWNRDVASADIRRMLEILFGSPFRTPTRDEYAMFMAAGAARRSAEFGRQVGAAIADEQGSIVALGANEVPKYGGGSHWEEDGQGNRDFEIGDVDTNRRHFTTLASRLGERAGARLANVLDQQCADSMPAVEREGILDAFRDGLSDDLRAAGLKDLTEFGRAVHAEMNAILDATRAGASVANATLYTTTFPCHNCTRHMIGAGMRRVVFIEPYEKSRAGDLHQDSVMIDEREDAAGGRTRIVLQPFVGVAPRRYLKLFDAASRERLGHIGRKDASGRLLPFNKTEARPVFPDTGPHFVPEMREYRARELIALDYFIKEIASHESSVRSADQTTSGDTHATGRAANGR